MQLWPVLLWPKPKARQHVQYCRNRNINLEFATRTFSTPAAPATITRTFLYAFIINTLLLITTTRGLTVTQEPKGNFVGVNAVSDAADAVSALTGLSNGYATLNYMKNYFHVREAEATEPQKQQQQQQHQNNGAAEITLGHPGNVGGAAVNIGRGFIGLQPNNYGNSIVARGPAVEERVVHEDTFNVYDGGFVPTTFSAAGQHYAASLVGLQTATDKSNALQHYATTAENKNNLHATHQPYGNRNGNSKSNIKNSNNNNNIAETDSNKAQQSLFRRLSNYVGGHDNDGGAGDASVADDKAVAGTGSAGLMQNYALTYANDAQKASMLQNFYNQQTTFNDGQAEREQIFANYFPPSIAATATASYEIENPQKYSSLNNYEQTTNPHQQFELQQFIQYHQKEHHQQPYQQKQQTLAAIPAPATYYQNFIRHTNDNNNNNKEHHHQHRHVAGDNYHTWNQNQIMANYQPKQSAIEKQQQQQQQHQQQSQSNNNNRYHQHHLMQEPETAETSHSMRIKKSPKHKSKRHDAQEHAYNYDALLEHNDITSESDDLSAVQLQQLQQLQHQLHQQQQRFVDLQHQLIDHDQQLQIQKQLAQIIPPKLPPITHTVHHNAHSLQALSGTPLSQHTQIIKSIPIPQRQQVHVPYRQNVTIEVPDPVITTVNKLIPIEIPVTKTVTVPNIQEVKIPIQKLKPFPVERPIPYIVEKRVPYAVEKQIAKPVYYPVPIKVPIVHTVVHKVHQPHDNYQHQQNYGHGNYHQPHHPHSQHYHPKQHSFHLPHTVYHSSHGHGHGHGHGHSYGRSHLYLK